MLSFLRTMTRKDVATFITTEKAISKHNLITSEDTSSDDIGSCGQNFSPLTTASKRSRAPTITSISNFLDVTDGYNKTKPHVFTPTRNNFCETGSLKPSRLLYSPTIDQQTMTKLDTLHINAMRSHKIKRQHNAHLAFRTFLYFCFPMAAPVAWGIEHMSRQEHGDVESLREASSSMGPESLAAKDFTAFIAARLRCETRPSNLSISNRLFLSLIHQILVILVIALALSPWFAEYELTNLKSSPFEFYGPLAGYLIVVGYVTLGVGWVHFTSSPNISLIQGEYFIFEDPNALDIIFVCTLITGGLVQMIAQRKCFLSSHGF